MANSAKASQVLKEKDFPTTRVAPPMDYYKDIAKVSPYGFD